MKHRCSACGRPCDCPEYTPEDGCMTCSRCNGMDDGAEPEPDDLLLTYAELVVNLRSRTT